MNDERILEITENKDKYYVLGFIQELIEQKEKLRTDYDRIYNENCKLRDNHNITDISLLDETQQLRIEISARKEEYKKLEETNKVLTQELTKGNTIKQEYLTTCYGIPIGDIPKLKNNWNELKNWLEENWEQTQDIWYVKILNKMRELERKSE